MLPKVPQQAVAAIAAGAAVGLAAFMFRRMRRSSSTPQAEERRNVPKRIPDDIIKEYTLTKEQMQTIIGKFLEDMQKSLDVEGGSSIKMIPTFVDDVATGDETGSFFAVDLGGSNFRVIKVVLGSAPHSIQSTVSESYPVPDEIQKGRGTDLFDFMAKRVMEFLKKHGGPKKSKSKGGKGKKAKKAKKSKQDQLDLAFTFSFPTKQTGVASGELIHWAKGYTASDVVGVDIVDMLRNALDRAGLHHVRITVLANDTVGTMMTGSYKHQDVQCGLIFGTGTNACYIEDAANIKKWEHQTPSTGKMVINTEWGDFDSQRQALLYTPEDNQIDATSVNTGQQHFEKMISGMYLGELFRLLVVRLHSLGCIGLEMTDDALADTKLATAYSIPSSFLSEALRTEDAHQGQVSKKDLKHIQNELLEHVGIEFSFDDCRVLRHAAELVIDRAAQLSAVGICAIFYKARSEQEKPSFLEAKSHGSSHRKKPPCSFTAAVDGSVFLKNARFANKMRRTVDDILGNRADPESGEAGFHIVPSEDGSGIGSALIAAVMAKRMKSEDSISEFDDSAAMSSPERSQTNDSFSTPANRTFGKHLTSDFVPGTPNAPQNMKLLASEPLRRQLAALLPPMFQSKDWKLLYSSLAHGSSLRTLYRNVDETTPSLVIIRDLAGNVFGGFATDPLKSSHSRYSGTGECFVFKYNEKADELDRFGWKEGNNEYFQTSTLEYLAFGGGGDFAIWVDQDLQYGSSGECSTYDSPVLSSAQDFRLFGLEVWTPISGRDV